MDATQFDALTRALAGRTSRRLLAPLASLPLLGGLAALINIDDAEAKKKKKKKKKKKNKKKCKPAKFCNGKCGVQTCQKKQVDCGPCSPPACDQATACSGKCGTVTCQGQQFNCGTCPTGDCDVCASGCPHQTIQAAINAASSGDTITICAGTYTRPTTGGNRYVALIRGKNLTLIGAGAAQTILDGGGVSSTQAVVAVENTAAANPVTVTLQNMTVTGANGSPGMWLASFGALVTGPGNLLTLKQVVVRNNTTTGVAGGIGVSQGTVILDAGTEVRNNSAGAGQHGGGIHNRATLIVNDGASVTDNQAGDSGGGIYNSTDGVVTLNNGARVSGNEADEGGGIYNAAGDVTLVAGSVVCGNSPDDCDGFGGGYDPDVCPNIPVCPA